MTRSLRTAGRVLAVSCLTVSAVVPFGSSGHADGIHTDTKLAGFQVSVVAAPLQVMLDDPELQIPRPPGSDVVEADPNYTSALVAAGPNAQAVASSLWPGNLFGEGLPALANGQAYPLKAEARYPDKPYTASGPDGGLSTNATAEGLDAYAQADGTPTNKPGQVTVGNATSTSTATVTDKDVAVGTAVSALQNVDLLAGLVHIGQIATHITASTDGKKPTASGTTTMSGLTIAGQSFGLDDKGLHAGPQASGLPALTTPQAVSDALGVTVTGLTQTTVKTSNGINRFAGGVVIRIDTAPLRKALSPVLTNVNPVLRSLISQLPPDVASNLYYFTKATPNITFVLGSASVGSAATLPLSISFDFPPPDFPGGPSVGPATGTGSVGSPPLAGGSVPPLDASPSDGGVPPTVTAPSATGPGTNVASVTDAGSGGIGAGYLVAALAVSGLIGWALSRFLGLAGGGVLGFGCRLGAPTSVPNLRSVTS